jgi:hypothetical protein
MGRSDSQRRPHTDESLKEKEIVVRIYWVALAVAAISLDVNGCGDSGRTVARN